MTTIGKILVFLVFVAALGMGGLMVYVSRTTPNWKAAVDDREEKIKLYQAMLRQERDSREKLVRENETMRKLLDNNSKLSMGDKTALDAQIVELNKQLAVADNLQQKADTLAKKAEAEAVRLQKELEHVNGVVGIRDKMIVKLQADIAVAETAAQAAKNDRDTATARAVALEARIREVERRAMADAQQPKSQPGSPSGPKDATYSNPPPVYVKGRVEQVNEADKSVVKLTIGSDSGLQKDQTLEVYRFNPRAEYVGRLLIVDADLHHSVAKLLRQPGMAMPTLQAGDEVASKLK